MVNFVCVCSNDPCPRPVTEKHVMDMGGVAHPILRCMSDKVLVVYAKSPWNQTTERQAFAEAKPQIGGVLTYRSRSITNTGRWKDPRSNLWQTYRAQGDSW